MTTLAPAATTRTVGLPSTEAEEVALQTRLKAGGNVETVDEMTDRYRLVLKATISISADLEVMTLPLQHNSFFKSNSINERIALASALQDEMGHAQIMFRLLEDFGIDPYEQLFIRRPEDFKTFYNLEWEPIDAISTAVGHIMGDAAGYITTIDLESNCSYGPYSRSLRKVNFEENFHVKRGEYSIRHYMGLGEEVRQRVQAQIDLTFPRTAEWFGTTDDVKSRTDQLHYRVRGLSNDQLRQQWLSRVVPFCEEVGLKVPAHFDAELGIYVLDYQLPILFDNEAGKWDFRTVTWEEKKAQWKRGGPFKIPGLTRLQQELWGDDLW
ncbi:Phenylacetic acid catabolic protein (plasmid) [Agrobacterium fabrum]|uniref:1,2-phenylacetyl-CoA epoxidase subunit PaaC n=1 Tax=Agrobacterium fabrum TaxID=1176649 RepID=UPI001574D37A|nr:Phenylacetic acid catabolic protein [Agrobacterium fabrum]NTB10507.1 phenylacetic acid catabolic family protein [Agrobacterium fabrum]